jgi:hypothetical protein
MPKAIRFHTTGGPDTLRWEDVEVGEPGPGETLVVCIGTITALGQNANATFQTVSSALPSGS